jgi:hypothetical protein
MAQMKPDKLYSLHSADVDIDHKEIAFVHEIYLGLECDAKCNINATST